ncbi:hypothetical protein JCM1841_003799 [Sporobolomyces salmonicolor]
MATVPLSPPPVATEPSAPSPPPADDHPAPQPESTTPPPAASTEAADRDIDLPPAAGPNGDAAAEGTPPPAHPAPEADDDIEARAEKKRKLEAVRAESRKRGNRMFGVMLGTLKRAKQDTTVKSDAAKKRQELEERLASKLGAEKKEMEEKIARERETKELKLSILKKEEDIATADSIYRARHDAKLNLAGFLCTTFTLPPPEPTTDSISVPFTPRLPHAMKLTSPAASRPIYYLPYRLLPSQEDRIEDQIAAVKKQVRRDRDEWEDVKEGKLDELEKARRKRDERMEEIERAEREERQRRRREQEEKEERERDERARRGESPPGAARMAVDDGEAPAAPTNGQEEGGAAAADGPDAATSTAENGVSVSAQVIAENAPSSNDGAAVADTAKAEDAKMEVGDEDLEY